MTVQKETKNTCVHIDAYIPTYIHTHILTRKVSVHAIKTESPRLKIHVFKESRSNVIQLLPSSEQWFEYFFLVFKPCSQSTSSKCIPSVARFLFLGLFLCLLCKLGQNPRLVFVCMHVHVSYLVKTVNSCQFILVCMNVYACYSWSMENYFDHSQPCSEQYFYLK